MNTASKTIIRLGLVVASVPARAGIDRGPRMPERSDSYVDTPGAHSERPGKHSTTTGRHGTTDEIGGGIDSQSGNAPAGDLDRLPDGQSGIR